MARIFMSRSQCARARVLAPERYATKPADLSWAEAAGVPVAVETAVGTLDVRPEVRPDDRHHGAAGGVGNAAVHFARARGGRHGHGQRERHEFLRTLGAEPTTYGDGLVDRVRELAGNGVDRALDTAGRGALPELIEITGSPDHVVTIVDFSAAEHGVRVTTGADNSAWGRARLMLTAN